MARVESELKPGAGSVDLFAYMRGSTAGVGVELRKRWSDSWLAYLRAAAEYDRVWRATIEAGLRGRF